MSKHKESENTAFPHSEEVEYAVWTPTEFKVRGMVNGKLRPRTIKKVTESMLNQVIEHTLEDQPTLPPPSEVSIEEAPVDPLSLVPPEIIEEAKQQGFDEGFVQGHTDGYQSGLEQGHAEGFANAKSELARLESIAKEASTVFTQFEEQIAPQILALSVEISKRILRRELLTDRSLILKVIDEAFLELLGSETQKRLLLHPSDLEIVQKELGESLKLGEWDLHADESITPGGCKIHSKETDIDATVERYWKRLMIGLSIPEQHASLNIMSATDVNDDTERVETPIPLTETQIDNIAEPILEQPFNHPLPSEDVRVDVALVDEFSEEPMPDESSTVEPNPTNAILVEDEIDHPPPSTHFSNENTYVPSSMEDSRYSAYDNLSGLYETQASPPLDGNASADPYTNHAPTSLLEDGTPHEYMSSIEHSQEEDAQPVDVEALIHSGLEAAFASALEMTDPQEHLPEESGSTGGSSTPDTSSAESQSQ